MERATPSRRGLACPVKCGLFILICLIIYGGISAYRRGRATMQAFDSGTNLRELGGVLARYAQSHDGRYPDRLSELVLQENVDPTFFLVGWGSATRATGSTPQQRAAQMDAGGHCSYAYLGAGRRTADMNKDMVVMYEADGENPLHEVFCLFGDGHCEPLAIPAAITAIINTVKAASPTTNPTAGK